MQCVNCGFENLPNLQACAHCQSVLDPGDLRVEPHRASALNLSTRLFRGWYRLRTGAVRVRHLAPTWRSRFATPFSERALAWSIVPGLGHLRTNSRRIGWTLLVVWLGFLVSALLAFPSDWSRWFVSFAIMTHAVAICSLFAASLASATLLIRMVFGFVVFLILSLLIYYPAGVLCGQLASPLRVPALPPGQVVKSGDGLIYEGPWLRPATFARGDIVVYEIAAHRGRGYYTHAGLGLDRVVAIPGDRIALRDGVLLVNGQPPSPGESPLGLVPHWPDFDAALGEGQHAILPSRLQLTARDNAMTAAIARMLTVIPDDAIRGRVMFRLKPWSRFGFVR